MNAAIDISPAQRKSILALLRQHLPGVLVWAYGSRVKWTARPSSDLDLVAFSKPSQSSQVTALKEAFEESDLPFPIDLFVWDEVPENFRIVIVKDHAVIQEAKDGKAKTESLADWSEMPFAEAVLVNPRTPLESGKVYPFIDMQAISPGTRDVEFSEHREFKGGGSRFQNRDTLMARITPCLENGKIARYLAKNAEDFGHGSTEFIVVRGRPGVTNNDFAYYLTISPDVREFAISQMTGTSGRQRVPTDALGGIPVLLPTLVEQKAIAGILCSLDDKIELNRRMNKTLEDMTQAIFGKFFPYSPEDDLPKGWRAVAIAELCELNSWTLGKSDELNRIDYIEISDVSYGNINLIKSYTRGDEPGRARRRLRHGDTVLSTVRPERGAYFLCLNPTENLIASTGFTVITPKTAPWSFIHAALTRPAIFQHLGQLADGGAYPAIRPEVIGNITVPWPDDPKIVTEYHKICSPIFERMDHNRSESHTLAALRESLLPKLLSGELCVIDQSKRNPLHLTHKSQ